MMNAGRQKQIHLWLRDTLGERFSISGLTGDASFRKYYRIKTSVQSFVLMDADHEEENLRQFVFVSKRLQSSGLHVPTIEHADFQKNLLLLEDLGDQLLLSCINDANAGYFYRQAIQDLLLIQKTSTDKLLPYGESKLQDEMDIFRDWLCEKYLGYRFSSADDRVFKSTGQILVENALSQPQVFVHGDYHSRNILVQSDGLAHIDYQDAVSGPLCYDLVSLLKDCYIKWPNGKIEAWIDDYLSLRNRAGHVSDFTIRQFRRWFDLMGLQRHLKASGIFCRLLKRDGKSGYLKDVPRVFQHMLVCCDQYAELHEFRKLLGRLYDLFTDTVVSK